MHLTEIIAMKFSPFFFILAMVGIDLKKHICICKIRLGKSHFSSARLHLISQQPLSLIGMIKCLSECLWKASRPLYRLYRVIFCVQCYRVSDSSHTQTVALPRVRITLIITNWTCILFDKRTCWPKFQLMLCAHGSMYCVFLHQVLWCAQLFVFFGSICCS